MIQRSLLIPAFSMFHLFQLMKQISIFGTDISIFWCCHQICTSISHASHSITGIGKYSNWYRSSIIVIHWYQQLRFKMPDSYPVFLSMSTNWPFKTKASNTGNLCSQTHSHTVINFPRCNTPLLWFKRQWAAKLHTATHSLPHFRLREGLGMIKLRKLVSWNRDSLIGKAISPHTGKKKGIHSPLPTAGQRSAISRKTRQHHVL